MIWAAKIYLVKESTAFTYGNLASHVMGYTKVDRIGVNFAKIAGISGVRKLSIRI